jgi:hypothetical protein
MKRKTKKVKKQYKGGSPSKVKVPQGYFRKAIRANNKRLNRGR